MTRSDLIAEARRAYGRDLAKLLRKALSDVGNSGIAPAGRQYKTPRTVARSLIDRDVEVHVLADHIPVGVDTADFQGRYPAGSRLLAVSVSGRHARTGAIADLDHGEAEAWALSLAPEGFEDFVVRLGQIATAPSRATHYRSIRAPDQSMCAIDPRDVATLRASALFV